MAQTGVVSTSFWFKVSKVSNLTDNWSNEIYVQGAPWKVKVSKIVNGANESLGVYLYCTKTDKSSNWSHAATASFKLRSIAVLGNTIERHIEPYIFDNSEFGCGFHSFVSWTDLLDAQKGYVQNDTIDLKIKIEAEDPNGTKKSKLICANVEKCCEEGCVATYRLTVSNIDNLMAVRSKELILRKIGWFFTIYKSRSGNLGIFFENRRSPVGCSCNAKMTSKLISSKAEIKKIEQVKIGNVKYLRRLDVDNLISWTELIKKQNGYVNNGSIVIEVEIKLTNLEGLAQKDGNHNATAHEGKRLSIECAICFEGIANKALSNIQCGHTFCTACITEAIKTHNVCPMCGAAAKLEDLRRTYLNTLN